MGGGVPGGVVQTDKWLKDDIANPIQICDRFKKDFKESSPTSVYQYLARNGMYLYNNRSKSDFDKMVENNTWGKIESFYKKYNKKWSGPDIPVYIFPHQSAGLFSSTKARKTGLAFKDKLFLFYSPNLEDKELEAVFVHEYHHVCRLNSLKKEVNDFTLQDSVILEGLAEHAVGRHVGKEYLANWTKLYSQKEIQKLAKTYIVPNLDVNKDDRLHYQLLYGVGKYPRMLGYATGYHAIAQYKKDQMLSDRLTFTEPAEYFLQGYLK